MDVRDIQASNLEGFDAIIHLAALSNDLLGDIDPDLTCEINGRASVRLAKLAEEAGVARFLLSSSCSMYGTVGEEMLTDVVVTDDSGTPGVPGDDVTFIIGTLAPGASAPYPGFYFPPSSPSTNTVMATGMALGSVIGPEYADATCKVPTSQLAHTWFTCQDFVDHTPGGDITEVQYSVKDGLINQTNPGVFYYYTQASAPSASFTTNIAQTNDNAAVPLFGVHQEDQIRLFNADCTMSDLGTISNGGGQASIAVNGATAGQVFIVSVKYHTSSVNGTPEPGTMNYTFETQVGGAPLDSDSLTLRKK